MISSEEWSVLLNTNRERFQNLVSHYSIRDGDCIIWTGAATLEYGVMSIKTSRGWTGIRITRMMLAYAGLLDISNPKLEACHKCDRRRCINLDHLFVGTQKDNMSDAARKGRIKVPGLEGVNHPSAKLSETQVREIRASKEPSRAIAKRFNVSKFAIQQVRNGNQYRSVM